MNYSARLSRCELPQYIQAIYARAAFALTIALSAALVILLPRPVNAQAPTTSQSSSQACATSVWMCPNITDLDPGKLGSHRLRLQASHLPTINDANGQPVDVHVVCGISTPDGDLFTSGNEALDKKLCIGAGTLAKMQALPYEYRMSMVSGSRTFQSKDGSANVVVKPVSRNIEAHSCFFVWELPPEVVDKDGGGRNEASGDQASLKYATFRFEGAPSACMSFRADPFGRVFNSQTLKPVPGATVSLFDFDSKQLYRLPGVTNPSITLEDGLFNFNIEPGTTYLQTNLTNAPQNVHANASLAYRNIYTYGDPIVETLEKAELRDIPVAGGNPPILKLTDYSNLQFGNETRIDGKASWPLTFVEVMQGDVLSSKNADEFGVFNFMIQNGSIDPTQKIIVRLTEVDLTKITSSPVPVAGAKTVEKEVDPIPRYLEGLAYDKAGNPIPYAVVNVKLKLSDQVYYQTEADQRGYFSVGPRFLPILPYYLEFSAPRATGGGSSVGNVVTIPEYAAKNKDYHRQNQIDIMAGTKAGRPIDPGAVLANTSQIGKRGAGGVDGGSGNDGMNDGSGSMDGATGARRGLLDRLGSGRASDLSEALANRREASLALLFILVVLFFVVAFGLAVYLKKKHGDARGDSHSEYGSGDRIE